VSPKITQGYLSRWRIEETIRFVKQSYGFENLRVMSYASIRNMAALVLVSAYFATVWIGRNVRHEILAEHLKYLSKRMGQIPEFAAYTIADGIKRAFTRFGKWIRTFGKTNAIDASATNDPMLPSFAEFFELDYG
jgi:abortive infection bacteriophage resistance protein